MATTSFEYEASSEAGPFDFNFPYLDEDDILVYVDGVLIPSTDYTISGDSIEFDSSQTGTILIKRDTNVDSQLVQFSDGSAWTGGDLNTSNLQLLYRLQEVEGLIEAIDGAAGAGGDGVNVPAATDVDQVLISGVDGLGFSWQRASMADLATALGIGGIEVVPDPAVGSVRVLVSNGTSYVLYTVAQAKTALGIGTYQLPTATGSNQFVVSNGAATDYQLLNVSQVQSALSLGSAAYKNTGTASGQIPLLVTSSGRVCLPAVSGELLTNIASSPKYLIASKAGTSLALDTAGTSEQDVTNGWTSSETEAETSGQTFATYAGGGITLSAGSYSFDVEIGFRPTTGGARTGLKPRLYIGTNLLLAREYQAVYNADSTEMAAVAHLSWFRTLSSSGVLKVKAAIEAIDGNAATATVEWCRIRIIKHA